MIKTTKDGRTIRDGKDYTKFRVGLYHFQAGHCFECDRFTMLDAPWYQDNAFHVHHVNGRGMGGGRRDDTIEACKGLCGDCHRKKHGQA